MTAATEQLTKLLTPEALARLEAAERDAVLRFILGKPAPPVDTPHQACNDQPSDPEVTQ